MPQLVTKVETTLDLEACAREPIHIPGSIQPYGALLVLSPDDLVVLQAAVGTPRLFGDAPLLGRRLGEILPAEGKLLADNLASRVPTEGIAHFGMLRLAQAGDERLFHAIAHRSDGAIILELEETIADEPGSFEDLYPKVREFLNGIQTVRSIEELGALAAREVRRLTGLDRALVYRFDEAWNGTVIAEDRGGDLPSYLDLRFPASDIPAQARELYRLNRLRLIADADYRPVPIEPTLNPLTNKPIDLSFSVLRSVSPVHLEYMRNMGTWASMSISLLRDGKLWGLISCHNREPHRVPFHIRTACDFIGQILSMQLASKEQTNSAERRIALRSVQGRLLAHMATEDQFVDALIRHPEELLGLTHAQGAAIVSDGKCALVGETPAEADVHRIVMWLNANRSGDLFSTDSLGQEMPRAEAFKDQASGLLAVSISQIHASYVLWFRPEVIRTVNWSGDPRKRAEQEVGGLRLHPRKSFEIWKETVRLRSLPWDESEIDAASELRSAIVDIVLRKAEELAALSEELTRSNRELEAFSYSVSHDLRAPFRHIVGYSQLLKQAEGDKLSERGHRYIDTVVESALSAGTLVDNLLSYSQMGRATLNLIGIDMNLLVAEARAQLAMEIGDRTIDWRIGDLPPTRADPVMLRLVVQNLLSNAIKFTREREAARIEVAGKSGVGETIYRIRDNGAGFDMSYASKLFGVFQRLHRVEEFEGTGIGLANVKRIIERHGGRVWAEGKVGEGATFHFALPNRE